MKRLLFFIILITIFGSCNSPKKKHWKVIWSAQFIFNNEEKVDSLNQFKIYLANYIEVNDSGKVRMMTHETFKGKENYYSLTLSENQKDELFNLVSIDSTFDSKKNKNNPCIYDGPTFRIEFEKDTVSKYYFLVPCRANQNQKEILAIFKSIQESKQIESIEPFDLKEYEEITRKQMINLELVPPPLKETIKFTPPIIKEEQ